MIEEERSRRIYLDSDKNEFATEEELMEESHAYACDRCITRTSYRKRTFYSSNDKRIYNTLNKRKVEIYEQELADKRHECYKRLPDICLKWYKEVGGDYNHKYYPICLAKAKDTCGGKKLLCKYVYESEWGTVRTHKGVLLFDIVNFVKNIDEGKCVQCSAEDVSKVFDDERARLLSEHGDNLDELKKDYEQRVGRENERYKDYLEQVNPNIEYDESKYIYYDNNGKMIE